MNLHDQIINLPCKREDWEFRNVFERQTYKEGHRDARHAAAELALQAEQRLIDALEAAHLEHIDTLRKFSLQTEQAEQDRIDAERYRWLRNKARSVDWSRKWTDISFTTHTRFDGQSMDAAIDAAIVKEAK